MTDSLLITLISTAGGVLVAFISVRFRKIKAKPEYIDTAMKGYENIMKRQDKEMARLRDENERLTSENERLRRGEPI